MSKQVEILSSCKHHNSPHKPESDRLQTPNPIWDMLKVKQLLQLPYNLLYNMSPTIKPFAFLGVAEPKGYGTILPSRRLVRLLVSWVFLADHKPQEPITDHLVVGLSIVSTICKHIFKASLGYCQLEHPAYPSQHG